MVEKLLGVIGGSGLYSMNELNVIEKVSVDTPFGPPSEDVVIGELNGTRMAFLPRHGVGPVSYTHLTLPTNREV